MPEAGNAAAFTAHTFAALGDPTRLGLVGRLSRGPAPIVRLAEGAGMSRQAVTKHLYVLERAGLVTCAKRGRTTVWALERRRLDEAKAALDAISGQWDAALERLRAFVEN